MSLGLLLFRLVLAGLLFGHGMQKLRGWFGGAGLAGTAVVFERWGFVPGRPRVLLAGVVELLGAGSLAGGFLTPIGSAAIIGTMTVAAVATAPHGFWAQQGGCEVPFCYGALAAIVGITGPGPWSVDHAVGLIEFSGAGWGGAAIGAGLLAAVVPLLARAKVLRNRRDNHNEVTG
jgi:putative oxidoreductase